MVTKAVARQALAALEMIRDQQWTIREECGNEDCVICPRKRKDQEKARKAIDALRKALES